MAKVTRKFGITVPQGGDAANRVVMGESIEKLDIAAAPDPLYLKSAAYDAGNNRLVLVFTPAVLDFLAVRVALLADTTYHIVAPAINTTYYVFVKNDGTMAHNTNGADIAGSYLIWQVATGATVSTLTLTDARGQLGGATAKAVQANLTAHGQASQTHVQPGKYVAATGRADQAVSFSELADVPGTFPPEAHNHDNSYFTKTQMGFSGQAAIHWDNVTNKPATFAPAGHKASHATNGSDPIAPADIGAPSLSTANTFTGRQTFQGGIQDGDGNQDVSFYHALAIQVDTRTLEATAWNASDMPTHFDIKDNTTVIGTIDITYNSDGHWTQAVLVAGGKTVTATQTWSGDRPVKRSKVVS